MKLIFHIGDDLAITVTTVFPQPRHHWFDRKTAPLEKFCRVTQRMITRRQLSLVEIIE